MARTPRFDFANSIHYYSRAYYENLLSGKGRSEALRKVQLEMIQAGDRYSHPYYWAAFVLTGEWRSLDN